MASQFYNRYIPPPSKDADTGGQPPPTKKRKKAKSKSKNPQKEVVVSLNLNDNAATEDNVPSSSPPKLEAAVTDKHHAILSKYRKVAAERPTKPPKDDAASEDQSMAEPAADQGSEIALQSHGLEPFPQPEPVEAAPKVSAFSALPEWLQAPISVPSTQNVPLNDLPINGRTLSSLEEKGYGTAFAIQSAVLPMLLPGPRHYAGDICISAATGSGKTLAYAIPMIEDLRDKPVTRLRGLIVVPTRELVSQVKSTLDLCSRGSGLEIGTAVGSKSLKEEQALLIHKDQRHDPEGYKATQEMEIAEEDLMDWNPDNYLTPKDGTELLYDHVVEYSSNVDILICTPGRLVEHVQSTTGFALHHVKWLVIDEADRLLDEGFQQWLDIVLPDLEYLPPLDPTLQRTFETFHRPRRREIRKIILSATMTRDVTKLTALKLRRPRLVVLEGQRALEATHHSTELENGEHIQLPDTLQEIGIKVPDSNEKPLYLIRAIESSLEATFKRGKIKDERLQDGSDDEDSSVEESTSSSDSGHSSSSSLLSTSQKTNTSSPAPTKRGILIFTKTNEHASRLARLLALIRPDWNAGISTLTKSSATSKALKILSSFQTGKTSILIASDRASRGLDIPDLAHVINYDMPTSLTSYVHRVGRTARAGKEGRATTLIAENEARWFWNDIARSEKVGRGDGRKVRRDNTRFEFGDELRRRYEEALETVGREARG